MSALAGIFKFDPRDHVDPTELAKLARSLDRIGPDGGSEHFSKGLGMVYRAFHSTPESHFEAQPRVRDGSVLTWDGRLDNGEELRSRVHLEITKPITDTELVLAAYQKWGTGCFAELLGDWSLALWDMAQQRLILARDSMGVRRLFYRLDADGVVWSTTIESLALTASRRLHPDLDYLAGCLYPYPPIASTAYQEIRSVLPASYLTFSYGGGFDSSRYWSLNPHAKIRYSSDSEYEDHFRAIFRESVRRRLRADRTILAELSGGVDSSSIVCMADDIRSKEPGSPIETISYFNTDEPSGDERPYFTRVEQKRGRAGHHISLSEFNSRFGQDEFKPPPGGLFSASPGYSARTLRWASAIEEIQARTGARVILSGLGGDEVTGGVQYEAPELADHLLAGRLVSLLRAALQWSLARRKTIYELLAEAIKLALAARCPESLVVDRSHRLEWAHLKPPKHLDALGTFSRWREHSPVSLAMESIRFVLGQQLTCTDLPLVGCAERRYPFLDRSLFAFIAAIPRTQVLQAGRRRHLLRRALCSLVPEQVLFRKTKWFGFRSSLVVLAPEHTSLDVLFSEPWLTDGVLFDTAQLRSHLSSIQHGAYGNAVAIRSAIGIEEWLRAQIRFGTIEFDRPKIDRGIEKIQFSSSANGRGK